jgi:hypothetical protein
VDVSVLGGGADRPRGCYRPCISFEAAHTVFLLSPANLAGARAGWVLRADSALPLAVALRGPGAALGDVFSFVSSLYFRGKAAYAAAFGRPPDGGVAGLVISPAEGLLSVDEVVTTARLRAWGEVPVEASNAAFTRPLVRDAAALERAFGATTRFVLLGSVASDKYVRPLTRVFGDHLLFPPAFVGRGDMSRGSMMLRAVRERRELPYHPVEGAVRSGARAARLAVPDPGT